MLVSFVTTVINITLNDRDSLRIEHLFTNGFELFCLFLLTA